MSLKHESWTLVRTKFTESNSDWLRKRTLWTDIIKEDGSGFRHRSRFRHPRGDIDLGFDILAESWVLSFPVLSSPG